MVGRSPNGVAARAGADRTAVLSFAAPPRLRLAGPELSSARYGRTSSSRGPYTRSPVAKTLSIGWEVPDLAFRFDRACLLISPQRGLSYDIIGCRLASGCCSGSPPR